MFGFMKGKPIDGTPGARPPKLGDLSMQEKLFALSAILSDDPETAMKIPMLAQQRAQRAYKGAAENDLARYLTQKPIAQRPEAVPSADTEALPMLDPSLRIKAPQIDMPMRDPRADAMGGPVSMRSALPMLAEAARRGVDVSSYATMIKGAQPEWKYERGMRFDVNDPNGGPKEIVDTDKGQTRLYDADGRFAGIRNAEGYVASVAELEGAKTRATEGAKADYDIGEYKDAGGIPRRMTRGDAVRSLPRIGGGTVSAPEVPSFGGLSTPQRGAVDISRGQSTAEAALTEGRAKNTVEQEGIVGKAVTQGGLDLQKIRDQAKTTLGILDKIRRHPSIGDRTGNSTLLPALRTQDVDFDVLVKQVSGGAFLEAIETLKGSGQITEIEGAKATDAIARMSNQRQSEAGFRDAMKDYEDVVRMGQSRAEKRAAGQTGARTSTPAQSRYTPEQARAVLARRRAERGM